jgi:hypothetical protein
MLQLSAISAHLFIAKLDASPIVAAPNAVTRWSPQATAPH